MLKIKQSEQKRVLGMTLIHRIHLGVLLGFFTVLIWASTARLDITVSARGTLIPQNNIEQIYLYSPSDTILMGEINIPQKDIGFIQVGQKMRVKIDTFSFMTYGAIEGEIITISERAYEEKGKMFYRAQIRLSRQYLKYTGEKFHLLADMGFAVEIKTGSRRIIDYAVKPIMVALEQSFEER